ncbi:MAG: hypothetical protein HQL68_09760 [Magnetococcales bacterium]|nr:hypothetical protein [Magnetococcales bacterium]
MSTLNRRVAALEKHLNPQQGPDSTTILFGPEDSIEAAQAREACRGNNHHAYQPVLMWGTCSSSDESSQDCDACPNLSRRLQ